MLTSRRRSSNGCMPFTGAMDDSCFWKRGDLRWEVREGVRSKEIEDCGVSIVFAGIFGAVEESGRALIISMERPSGCVSNKIGVLAHR